jgi:hypothetical protein
MNEPFICCLQEMSMPMGKHSRLDANLDAEFHQSRASLMRAIHAQQPSRRLGAFNP